MRRWLLIGTLAACVSACGGAAQPQAQLSDANAAVRAASEVGAADVPEASLHLKLARDQIAEARQLMKQGENDKARWVLVRAQADAEAAVAQAKAVEAQQEAARAQAQIDELQKGNTR